MKLGISMDAYFGTLNPFESIVRLKELGFEALDFNLSDYCYVGSPLTKDNWESWLYQIKDVAEKNNISFSQVHAPFQHIIDVNKNDEFLSLMTIRCFKACEIIGIPWAVFHPMVLDKGLSSENVEFIIKYNIERIKRLCNIAAKCKTGVALENVFDMRNSSGEIIPYWGTKIDEIISLVDNINLENFGVCLDTGHAFIVGINPAEAVKKLNHRLKVLHVHDNNGMSDLHLAPFVGNINWMEFIDSLKSIGYSDVFSLEIHNYTQRMSKNLIDDAILLSKKIAKELVSCN